jgi:hypothetical protein
VWDQISMLMSLGTVKENDDRSVGTGIKSFMVI